MYVPAIGKPIPAASPYRADQSLSNPVSTSEHFGTRIRQHSSAFRVPADTGAAQALQESFQLPHCGHCDMKCQVLP